MQVDVADVATHESPYAKVVVVGGGPVGLWTAIQTRIRSNANVVVLERYNEYKRKHVLQIDPSSFKQIPDHADLKNTVTWLKGQKRIATNTIEEELSRLAHRVGVKIFRGCTVDNPESLRHLFPLTHLFIGADGAHSKMRETVFHNTERYRKPLKHIVEVKYHVQGPARPQHPKVGWDLKKDFRGHIVENVGQGNADGTSPVTLRLFITQEEYNQLRQNEKGTFKNPLNLSNPEDEGQVPERVKTAVMEWLASKERSIGEMRVDGEVKLSTVELGYYASAHFVQKVANAHFALVGDAAFGVPFFRSLNNGLRCGTKLSQALSSFLADGDESHLKAYERYVGRLAAWESTLASVKSSGVGSLESSIASADRVTPPGWNRWALQHAEGKKSSSSSCSIL